MKFTGGFVVVCLSLMIMKLTNAQLEFSECLGDRQYALNEDVLNFIDSLNACENEGAILAQLKTQQNFDDLVVLGLLEPYNEQFAAMWFGLRALDPTADPSDPLSYSFLDGTTFSPGGFGSTAGENPWLPGEPSDLSCVAFVEFDNFAGFADGPCDLELNSVCEKSCSTNQVPTFNPTAVPTESPTLNPSTGSPTVSPTLNPSTGSPTVSPTLNPSTGSPTLLPTNSLTDSPTQPLTLSPTTRSPTLALTEAPTKSPSEFVSIAPTVVDEAELNLTELLIIVAFIILGVLLCLCCCLALFECQKKRKKAKEVMLRKDSAVSANDVAGKYSSKIESNL